MDWLGIGVLIIGIVFGVLTLFLIKPIRKLTDVLNDVKQTTNRLPEVVEDLTMQTTEVMKTSNATIANVNEQVKEVSPFFHIIGDTGEATRKLTLDLLGKTNNFKTQTNLASDFTKREKYEGIYGILSFILFLSERKNKMKNHKSDGGS